MIFVRACHILVTTFRVISSRKRAELVDWFGRLADPSDTVPHERAAAIMRITAI
jgi:hypothetical protein